MSLFSKISSNFSYKRIIKGFLWVLVCKLLIKCSMINLVLLISFFYALNMIQ